MIYYINDKSKLAISGGFYFHKTSLLRRITKIKHSQKIPNLHYVSLSVLLTKRFSGLQSQFSYFSEQKFLVLVRGSI